MASENTADKPIVENTSSNSTSNSVSLIGAGTTNYGSKPVPAKTSWVSKYSIDDFAAAFKTMDATPDVVRAALRMAGKTAFTKEEAQTIIKQYQSKEVKA
jgi:hypothetical protein